MNKSFIRTDSSNPDFVSLVAKLDADLAIRDGDEHAFYDQFNKIDRIRHAMIGIADDNPVTCGAFVPINKQEVEIKRMYTLPKFRGQGLASALLAELESWAKELHYTDALLETGLRQPEAIALYHKCGYHLIENYGPYVGVENSVCFRKTLDV